jgi:hypothetical protein
MENLNLDLIEATNLYKKRWKNSLFFKKHYLEGKKGKKKKA